MANISDDTFYKSRETILADMLDALVSAVPDAYTGRDGIIRILLDIEAGQHESVFLANQLLLEDCFIPTASLTALRAHGEQYGEAFKDGTRATGNLVFTGQPGQYIPFNTEVAYDPGTGIDPVYFVTSADNSIPNLGAPSPPTAAVGSATGLTGTYVYKVTFYSAGGETTGSSDSNAVNVSNQKVDLSNIPLGGSGTVGRRIYRQKNGTGDYKLVVDLNNNSATTYTDNIADGSLGATIPTSDTSNRVSIAAEAQDPGIEGNALPGTILSLTNAPTGLTDVTNPAAFTGGSDPEDTEDFRQRLLNRVRSPGTGSPGDLKSWAEDVDGVESATVFSNDNEGTPTNGHTTVRISAPGGAVPSSELIATVLATLEALDIANITIHVAGFTQQPTDVTVTLTLDSAYDHADVDAGVEAAIIDYINQLEVGETLYRTGIVAAIVGLPGILDVSVGTPATNLTTASTTKRTPGTITVN